MAGPAQALPLLWLNPINPVTDVGQELDVVIQLDGANDVFGSEINLSFNPAILQVSGTSISPGTCPQPDFVAANFADNTAGTINYGVTQLSPTPPCDGGVLATISFECVGEGVSPVSFISSIVNDQNGTVIPSDTQNGTVECQGDSSAVGGTVSGLEGEGMVLQNNATDDLLIKVNGSFTFATPLKNGSTYAVTVKTHPSDPDQVCSINNGGGTVDGDNITDLIIRCFIIPDILFCDGFEGLNAGTSVNAKDE